MPVFAFPYLYSILVSSLIFPFPGILRRSWYGTLPSMSFCRVTGCKWRALWIPLLLPRTAPTFPVFYPTHLSLSTPKCLWELLQLDRHAHISFSAAATMMPLSYKHNIVCRESSNGLLRSFREVVRFGRLHCADSAAEARS